MLGFESTVDRLADAFLLLCIVELYTLRTAMQCSMYISLLIRESVDSLCRDGTDTPYTQYKIKVFKSLQKITFKLS